MKELKIGNLVANLPIVQGGMGIGISLSGLASAVANQGGIGVISAACIGFRESDFYSNFFEANIRALRNEIRRARELTKGILGVNIMTAMSNFHDMVTTSIEEGIDIIFSGAGLPLNLPEYLNGSSHTKLVPIVSSARAAKLIAKKWIDKYSYVPDAFVVEGPLAGGHLGFQAEELFDSRHSLEQILQEVISEVKPLEEGHQKSIPIIAAGGIYSGSDIYRMLSIGAGGVQMATRFVATEECDASLAFKLAYINAKKEDIVITNSPVRMPGRAIMNEFIHHIKSGAAKPKKCLFHCIKTCDYKQSPYCISEALINAQTGNMEEGLVFAGQKAFQVQEIASVAHVFKQLMDEYTEYESSLGLRPQVAEA